MEKYKKNLLLSRVNTFSLLPSIRCKNGMNHLRDRVPHMADGLCQYAHQYNNKVLICKVRMLFNTCLLKIVFKFYFWVLKKNILKCFAYSLLHISSDAMKEAERWLCCPRHQLPLITPGLDWLSMPGQGKLTFLHMYMNIFSYPS